MSVAMIFPGQGSQSVGMLADLAEAEPAVRETFDEASDCLGYDLWDLCQAGPEELLGRSDHTQPAMLTAGVAVFRAWKARGGAAAAVMAGHSLGEYTALVCAGYLDFRQAVSLVRSRGEIMQAAVPAGSGALAAILGLDDDTIARRMAWSNRSTSIPRGRSSSGARQPPSTALSRPPGNGVRAGRSGCRSASRHTAR